MLKYVYDNRCNQPNLKQMFSDQEIRKYSEAVTVEDDAWMCVVRHQTFQRRYDRYAMSIG